jgi:hypothetical protein
MKRYWLLIGISAALLGLFLTVYLIRGDQKSFEEQSPSTQEMEKPSATFTPNPTPTIQPTPSSTPTSTPIVVLDPDPQVVNFVAEDGQELSGIYYPAEQNPAPLIVLMHWARGDQEDWQDVAPWLQNRVELDLTPDYNRSWKSANWFPENTQNLPLGVFTFNFRSCEVECQQYLPDKWLLDARAAVITAAELQGVDRNQVLTAGASIGADGAVDACAWLNQSESGECLGSFALSPGSSLTLPFEDAAGHLLRIQPPRPVYCLYGLRDDASVETCADLPGLNNVDYGYIENHGMELLQPLQNPDPLSLMLDFISEALSGAGEESG